MFSLMRLGTTVTYIAFHTCLTDRRCSGIPANVRRNRTFFVLRVSTFCVLRNERPKNYIIMRYGLIKQITLEYTKYYVTIWKKSSSICRCIS